MLWEERAFLFRYAQCSCFGCILDLFVLCLLIVRYGFKTWLVSSLHGLRSSLLPGNSYSYCAYTKVYHGSLYTLRSGPNYIPSRFSDLAQYLNDILFVSPVVANATARFLVVRIAFATLCAFEAQMRRLCMVATLYIHATKQSFPGRKTQSCANSAQCRRNSLIF